jgi:nitrogen-specific signal transduction histidine kinase/CheY-like chemotaxis protein
VRLAVRTVYDGAGVAVAFEGVVEDLTERRALEERLRQAQKIEAIGQLAGGIAHDFNNLLTTIGASSDLLADIVPRGSEQEKDLEAIRRAAARGGELTAKLLAFGRRQRIEPQALDINEAVRDFAQLARLVVPESITIGQQLESGVLPVVADPGAVQQILMNLVTNARDAMPDGGMLGLHTARVLVDAEAVAARGWGEPGSFAMLAVRDTGTGMNAAVHAHIFEPFFTTKPVDQGTGLGMPMVYGLVQQHHGHIRVLSEPDHGTSVEMLFPLADIAVPAAPPAAGPRISGQSAARGGNELILLVDDEPALRRAGKRLLERSGYRVELASNGAEALETFLAREPEIALIVSDVVMPRMSGPELLTELRRRGKSPRILFTSGYTSRDSSQARQLSPGSPFVPKPWNNAKFLAAVREALDLEPTQ